MSEKKPKRVESLGPTGDLVRKRIEESRRARGYSFAELSRRLEEVGRPIPPLGLSRIEAGERRVDVDDLVAISWALRVAPNSLFVPDPYGHSVPVVHTALGERPSFEVEEWLAWGTFYFPERDGLDGMKSLLPRRARTYEEALGQVAAARRDLGAAEARLEKAVESNDPRRIRECELRLELTKLRLESSEARLLASGSDAADPDASRAP